MQVDLYTTPCSEKKWYILFLDITIASSIFLQFSATITE